MGQINTKIFFKDDVWFYVENGAMAIYALNCNLFAPMSVGFIYDATLYDMIECDDLKTIVRTINKNKIVAVIPPQQTDIYNCMKAYKLAILKLKTGVLLFFFSFLCL